jgi:hypothetical protein
MCPQIILVRDTVNTAATALHNVQQAVVIMTGQRGTKNVK